MALEGITAYVKKTDHLFSMYKKTTLNLVGKDLLLRDSNGTELFKGKTSEVIATSEHELKDNLHPLFIGVLIYLLVATKIVLPYTFVITCLS
jgi:hypothetical protein